jgi:type IV pilus assembly protein PilA
MKLNKLKQSKGFTLVEILIVVIIVGLLAGIAVSKLGDSKERAVQAVKKSAASELNKAIQAAYVKGNILSSGVVTAATGASATSVAGIQSLITTLSEAPHSTFTASSATEMRANVADTTPNGGFLTATVGTGSGHRDLEVVYNTGTYAP